jgi:hypothetical protein
LRVHDLRHTDTSLSRRAGADLRLLQKAMGHASITVTPYTYPDLFDDELDGIATALDSLDDAISEGPRIDLQSIPGVCGQFQLTHVRAGREQASPLFRCAARHLGDR